VKTTITIRHTLRALAPLALCAALAVAAPKAAATGSFRVISKLPAYIAPGGITEGSPGVFYSSASPNGSYVVFSVTAKGAITTLASFPSGYDIYFPLGASNGRFYDSVVSQANPGNVFSVSAASGLQQYPAQTILPLLSQTLPGGTLLGIGLNLATGYWYVSTTNLEGVVTSVHQFAANDRPFNPIIRASDGNHYGVSYGIASPYVYQVTPSGTLTNLHTFPPAAFKAAFQAPLLQGTDGNLYGAASNGGASGNGLIYKVSLTGQYSEVYAFPKGPAGYPNSLIQTSDGNLYGTTTGNSLDANGHSVLFRVTTSGQYTELHAWGYSTCQCYLTQGSDGGIYGIAQNGQEFFVWDDGLPKPAPQAPSFSPASGAVGTRVLLWGYNLLTPSVTFNGVPATSTTSSGPNYVWATVPAGAATGPITVTTPGGSYTTTANFTVQ
jgi:uncharacterized repeat protein (TIGR03803 family)